MGLTAEEKRARNRANAKAYRTRYPERAREYTNKSTRRWRERHPLAAKAQNTHNSWKRAGIKDMSEERYAQLLKAQGGACALCGRQADQTGEAKRGRRLSVDHDHATGRVRGLLCVWCNNRLGWYERASHALSLYLRHKNA